MMRTIDSRRVGKMNFKCNVCGGDIYNVMRRKIEPCLSNEVSRSIPTFHSLTWFKGAVYYEFSGLCYHCGKEWGQCEDLEELTKTMNEAGVLK
jgi:hypothetical protein